MTVPIADQFAAIRQRLDELEGRAPRPIEPLPPGALSVRLVDGDKVNAAPPLKKICAMCADLGWVPRISSSGYVTCPHCLNPYNHRRPMP